MKRLLIAFTLIVTVAAPVAATDFAGPNVVIPIAGRTSGAGGSYWKTDLVVTNAARTGNPLPVVIFFFHNGIEQQLHATLNPRESRVIKDVVKEGFGVEGALGMIRIATSRVDAKITARARIYNTGSPQGEYGQTVQGMPVTKLAREAYLPGLIGAEGKRTNIGISNPANAEASVFISLFADNGEFHGGFGITVAPRSVYQINNIFQQFDDQPLDRGTIQITSSHGVYAWASIVRGDTGDADFITATGVTIDTAGEVVAPQCQTPAPLQLAPSPSDGWIVLFHSGTNAFVETPALATKYGFTPKNIFNHALSAFSAELTQQTIASLRCEPAVKSIEQNANANPLP